MWGSCESTPGTVYSLLLEILKCRHLEMFSLVFSKEEGQVDSVKNPQHNRYFFYSISLKMEKTEQQAANIKLKNRNFIF